MHLTGFSYGHTSHLVCVKNGNEKNSYIKFHSGNDIKNISKHGHFHRIVVYNSIQNSKKSILLNLHKERATKLCIFIG